MTFNVAGDLSTVGNVHFHIDLGGLCSGQTGASNIPIDAPNWSISLNSSYSFSGSAPFSSSNSNGTVTGTITFKGSMSGSSGSGTVKLDVTVTNTANPPQSVNCSSGNVNWTAS